MRDVVIVSGKRTPIAEFMGDFKSLTAVELGTIALKAAIEQAGIEPSQIEEVIAGQVYQAGCKGNTGRQVAIHAGCPVETVCMTVNQQCPSSMRALEIISQEIMLNKIDIGAVVGMESMTNVPYLLSKARSGYRMGNGELVDGMLYDALLDAFNGYHQGITAENLVEKFDLTREEQDKLAFMSHQRASNAIKTGKFKNEIVPVEIKSNKGTVTIENDCHPKSNLDLETLQKMRPAFKIDGTVTAGNASSINDGGVALIVMAAEKANELGLKPIAKVIATASASVDPSIMGFGVVPAVNKVLEIAKMKSDDIDRWEINEAFAAQFLACNRELKLDMEKVNLNGSGIGLGHPVGMTGARLILSLITELKYSNKKIGCASLCAGGGPAMAVIIEAI